MTPIKVLQVFTVLNRGGAETNMMNYLRHMDRSQFQVDFLVHRSEPGAYEAEIRKLGGKIYRLPPLQPLKLHSYKRAVKKFFEAHQDYDIIHGQNSELGVFIYEEAKRRRVPVIIAHAHNAPKLKDYDLKFIFRELWKRRMRKSITSCFTCGQDSAEWLFGRKKGKEAYLMKNAVNTDDFVLDNSVRTRLRTSLGTQNKLNIVHVGRFNLQKNHRFLIDVFSEVIKMQPDTHLYLVGVGELESDIIARVDRLKLSKHITFLGLQEHVSEILQAMDVFLFPSLFEGLPVSLVEAQASGLFCVISDGISEEAIIVPEDVTVIPLAENAENWAIKITRLDLSSRKDNSDQIINKGYDIKDNVKKLENKYIQLLENASPNKPNQPHP